jgi:hypothetical protein
VVHGWSRLALAATCISHNGHHAGAAYLLVVATVAIDHGCGLLVMLLAPFPATLGALPDVLDGDVGRCLPAIAWGHVKLGRLAAGGVLGSNATQLLDGILKGIGQCLEGLCQWHVTRAASGHLYP